MGILSGTKPNLSTTEGLTAVAEKEGLGTQAKGILSSGENPKLIFSGGFIQDVFDALNAPQSAVTGILSNKGAIDAISSRASFSDKEHLGKYGAVGVLGGIVADIATDPLWLIPPLGIGKAIMRGIKGGTELIQATKMGDVASDFLAKRFVYRFAQPEQYKFLAEDTLRKINKGGQVALKTTRPITELTPAEQRLLTKEVVEGGRKITIRTPVAELPAELLAKAKPAFDEVERLGREMVTHGLLDKDIYEAGIGKYIRNTYRKYEVPVAGKAGKLFDTKPIRISKEVMKKRLQELPDDVREGLEPILEGGYPLAKSLALMNQAVERAKFFEKVSLTKDWTSNVAKEGFKQLSKTNKGLGKLRGKYVLEPIFNDIEEIFRAKTYGEKLAGKVVQGFKYGKVILNPATHARNFISNLLLNNFGGIPLARIPQYLTKAVLDIKRGGKYGKEIAEGGFDAGTFWGAEIKALLTNSGEPALKRIPKEIVNKMGDIYQGSEVIGKRMQYIFQREKGLEPLKAWGKAEEALFNYSQVTPFIRKLRESIFGMPFITFTYKATPFILKTAIENPARIGKFGLIKKGIENLSPEQQLAEERKAEPDYVKKGFFVRLPFADDYGRALYFDLTYILPFGDLASGNLFEGERAGEAYTTSMLRKFPALNMIGELYRNEDFFGEPIVDAKSDDPLTIGANIIGYMAKQYGPPPFVDTPKRIVEATKISNMTEAERGAKRTITEEILRNFGLKVKPFILKQEKARREREKKTQLGELLEQAGVVREFKVPFIPK